MGGFHSLAARPSHLRENRAAWCGFNPTYIMPALNLDQVKSFDLYKTLLKKDTLLTVPQPKKFYFATKYTFPDKNKPFPLLLLQPADSVRRTLEKLLPGKKFQLVGKFTTGKIDGDPQVFFANPKHAAFVRKAIGAVDATLKTRIHLPAGVDETDDVPESDGDDDQPSDDSKSQDGTSSSNDTKPQVSPAMQRKLDHATQEFEAKQSRQVQSPSTMERLRARATGNPPPPKVTPSAPPPRPSAPVPPPTPNVGGRTSLFGQRPPVVVAPPKVSKAEENYSRRTAKTEAALARLPKGHADLPVIQKLVADAKAKADAGDHRGAYRDLKNAKRSARRSASGYVKTLDIDDVEQEVDTLCNGMSRAASLVNGVFKVLRKTTADIAKHPKASSFKTAEEAYAFRRDFVAIEGGLRASIVGTDGDLDRAANYVGDADIKTVVDALSAKLLLLKEQKKESKKATALLLKLSNAAANFHLDGKEITKAGLKSAANQEEAVFEKRLAEWKDLGKFQNRDAAPYQNQFAHLLAKEEARLQAARDTMRNQAAGDRVLTGVTRDKTRAVKVLRRFDVDDFLDDVVDDALPPSPSDKEVDAFAQKAEAKIAALLKSEKTGSDVVFDLTLKSKAELANDLAMSVGLRLKDCTPEHKRLIDSMAGRVYNKLKKDLPNKASSKKVTIKTRKGEDIETAEEIALDGKKYIKPRYLGQGGLGTIIRYEDAAQPGKFVVVKTLNDPDPARRDEMVKELRMHRQAMGGEEGKGHKNVVGMRGVVGGEDESLHMVLDYEEGGDLGAVAQNLKAAEESGAIPPAARQVLTQHFFRQAVEGMRHVQGENMTHHDIKGANFLISGDGTVKVADFGSAQVVDNSDGVVSGKRLVTTSVYEAPEVGRDDIVTGKADTYSLGTMLDVLSGEKMGADKGFKGEFKPGEKAPSSLDRLKKAMLDPDPAKRPTLEAVQFSSLLNDSAQNYPQEQIDELVAATMAYSKKSGGKIADIQFELNYDRVDLAGLKEKRAAAARRDHASIDQDIAKKEAVIAAQEKRIAAVNDDPEIKPLLAELQRISAAFR